MAAGRSLAQIDRLGALLEGVPTGASGALKVAAGNFGIQTEGLDDLQAAQALINTLVPQQRPPGSGPMSDADLELFKQSLPRIINSPNGNKIILDTMRGVAQYDAMGAEIVQRYRAGDITQAEAFSQLQSRPDPFAGLNLGAAQAQPGGGMSREDALTVLGG
jgi:flagellar protein FlgJ